MSQQDTGTIETALTLFRASKEKPLPEPPSSEKKEAKFAEKKEAKFADVKIPRNELGIKVLREPKDVEEIDVEYVKEAPFSMSCAFFVSPSTYTDMRLMSKASWPSMVSRLSRERRGSTLMREIPKTSLRS